ncbi:MAG TPA: aldehyde dehydrogenase family protein, partial [Pseudonocardia sp.]|nr:aldehyde dehydrogenase family protein [Pseudonocardia sp.]
TIVSETGKTYEDAQLAEISYAASAFGFWAKNAEKYLADERVKTASPFVKGRKLIVRHVPVGVVGVIGPWNWPLLNNYADCIAPLCAGNAVILKPSPVTPLTSLRVAQLWRDEDLPEDVLQDPAWRRSGHTDPGRDGCRVPIPWSDGARPFGFSPEGATAAPWLPQPADFGAVSVAAQEADPGSMLALYRSALRLRRTHPALGAGVLTWRPAEPGVLAFDRDPGLTCVVNLSEGEVALPHGTRVLVSSAPLDGGRLPVDAAVWLES